MVREALLAFGCYPVEQTNFEPDARTVEKMLRGKNGDCQALIHLCGMRYGAELDAASLPPGSPRRSYTQMEHHIARQLQLQNQITSVSILSSAQRISPEMPSPM